MSRGKWSEAQLDCPAAREMVSTGLRSGSDDDGPNGVVEQRRSTARALVDARTICAMRIRCGRMRVYAGGTAMQLNNGLSLLVELRVCAVTPLCCQLQPQRMCLE